ncbi:MAG: hypothetical protein ACLQAH_17135 [Limisphaerales bacterium]
MTSQEQHKLFKDIAESLITCRRENLRTLARTKALEAMVRNSIPKEKQEAWHKRLNEETKACLHQLLVSLEKTNPAAAAQIDNRESWEVDDS